MSKSCVLCWQDKNNDGGIIGELTYEVILKEFVLCNKHKYDLKKEVLMIILCSGCGKPTTPRTVPKGPRGPWVANECLNGCMNGKYKLTTKANSQSANNIQAPISNSIENKIDQILSILKANFPPVEVKYEEPEEEASPF